METIAELTSRNAQIGTLEWICVRPTRREPVQIVQRAIITRTGISGDHNQTGGKRAVTLLQQEHLAVMASLLGLGQIDAALLRRNLIISGINLLGLRKRQFRIGSAVLEGSGICAPCSRMEEAFGRGGYAAVRGHGGITATIIEPGEIEIGDNLCPL